MMASLLLCNTGPICVLWSPVWIISTSFPSNRGFIHFRMVNGSKCYIDHESWTLLPLKRGFQRCQSEWEQNQNTLLLQLRTKHGAVVYPQLNQNLKVNWFKLQIALSFLNKVIFPAVHVTESYMLGDRMSIQALVFGKNECDIYLRNQGHPK